MLPPWSAWGNPIQISTKSSGDDGNLCDLILSSKLSVAMSTHRFWDPTKHACQCTLRSLYNYGSRRPESRKLSFALQTSHQGWKIWEGSETVWMLHCRVRVRFQALLQLCTALLAARGLYLCTRTPKWGPKEVRFLFWWNEIQFSTCIGFVTFSCNFAHLDQKRFGDHHFGSLVRSPHQTSRAR